MQSIAGSIPAFVLARNTNPAAAPWSAQMMFFGIDIQHQRDPIPSAALSHDIEHEPSRRRSIKLFKLGPFAAPLAAGTEPSLWRGFSLRTHSPLCRGRAKKKTRKKTDG